MESLGDPNWITHLIQRNGDPEPPFQDRLDEMGEISKDPLGNYKHLEDQRRAIEEAVRKKVLETILKQMGQQ